MKDLLKFFCEFLHENTSINPCINICTCKNASAFLDHREAQVTQRNNLVWFSSNMKDLTSTRFLFTWAPGEGENTPANLNRKLNGTCFNNN